MKLTFLLDEIGVIESVKSVSNIVAPISGTVTEINEALEEEPELTNKSPLAEGNYHFLGRPRLWPLNYLCF